MAIQTLNNLESAYTIRQKINNNFSELYGQKADKSHAFVDTSYGAATSSLYGHVKINVANGLSVSNGVLSMASASTSGIGAVQLVNNLTTNDSTKALTASQGKALNDSINTLSNNTPPKNHAVSNNSYGLATNALYGHVKVTAGNGLLLNNGTISFSAATTSQAGSVRLEDSLNSQSSTTALTAKQGYLLDRSKPNVYSGTTSPSNSLGRDGDIYLLLGN